MSQMQSIGCVMQKIFLRARVAVVFTSETKRSFVESAHGYRPDRHSWPAIGLLVAMFAVGGPNTPRGKIIKGSVQVANCGLRHLPPSNLCAMSPVAGYVLESRHIVSMQDIESQYLHRTGLQKFCQRVRPLIFTLGHQLQTQGASGRWRKRFPGRWR